MITRTEGIVIQDSDCLKVQVRKKFDTRDGKTLPIASSHGNIVLIPDLLVNFIITSVKNSDVAFDVCPVCLDDQNRPSTKEIINKKEIRCCGQS